MEFILSSQVISLLIGIIGAITGIISLVWHMFNSRSKVILDHVYFTRESYDRKEKEVIKTEVKIRNRGNRSTTIEDIYLEIGRNWIKLLPSVTQTSVHMGSNSSERLTFYQEFKPKEFDEILKENKIKLGVRITHTFGTLRKYGYTDFSTPWLSL